MRKIGLFIFGVGSSGILIGGSGLDSPASTVCVVLTAVSFLVAAVGYKIYEKSERSEEDKTAEEINIRPKETTFQMWLTAGKLDV